ncbi:MAG: arginine--tRNA ligase [Deltaproteobacteria bacterium]|nr:arginine--tRNA ligase [Deltaproteobacteria bacterium]
MSGRIKDIIMNVLEEASAVGALSTPPCSFPSVIIETPKKEGFGDFSTNLAMLLAPLEGRPVREVARLLGDKITGASLDVLRCEVAGPGFINIFLKESYWHGVLAEIVRKGGAYGDTDIGKGKKVQIEFVSANPTGPLHIGHARNASVGDTLANVMKAAGFEVTKEYYINDAGLQVYTLGESVRLRWLEMHCGKKVEFPTDYYKGEYVKELADEISRTYDSEILDRIPAGQAQAVPLFQEFACEAMLKMIKKDLQDFGVEFDVWYSEKEKLRDSGLVTGTMEKLRDKGFLYEKEGAIWFRTTDFGDDKDRVLMKADGELTYFASDCAYHLDKVKRGFSTVINIWGADHHGYETRVRAVFKAFGCDEGVLKIVFIQLVALTRGGVAMAMGKREGEFVTLREVLDEVGKDAMRFFFLMRKSDAHLDFDLELAKKQAPENPVYYVQYCHARIMSIMGFAEEKGARLSGEPGLEVLKELKLKEELDIIKHLGTFEEVVEKSAVHLEPYRLTFYLRELAGLFHPYYNRNRVVSENAALTLARLFLCKAAATVIRKGLGLLGVSAPVKM